MLLQTHTTKMIRFLPLVIAFLAALFSRAQQSQTIYFDCVRDANISSLHPDSTFGADQSTKAVAWTFNGQFGVERSLFAFDLCKIPAGFVLKSATLKLYHNPLSNQTGHTANGLNASKIYLIKDTWDESYVTWNNQPAIDTGITVRLDSAINSQENYSISVTALVDSCIKADITEIGFYLKLIDEQFYRSMVFASKEHPYKSIRPRLIISYTADSTMCSGVPIAGLSSNPKEAPCDFMVPNIFTPNGDSYNPHFHLDSICDVKDFKIEIFNRWGDRMFQSNDPKFKWDGTLDSQKVANGTYFYIIAYQPHEIWYFKKGTLTIVGN